MKSILKTFAILTIFLVGPIGCVSINVNEKGEARSLEGTWELVEVRYTPTDWAPDLTTTRQIKILTKDHWAYLQQKRAAPKLIHFTDAELLAAAKDFGAGGGSFTLDADSYTEHVEFSDSPNMIGAVLHFKIRWDGQEWIQTGVIPLKELGMAKQDLELYERYRRIR